MGTSKRPEAEVWRPTAGEVAALLDGRLRDASPSDGPFDGIRVLAEAGARQLSFVVGDKELGAARASAAGLLIVPSGELSAAFAGRARLEVDEVWPAVVELIERFHPEPDEQPGRHPTAIVGRGARLGEAVSIGPYAIVGDGAVIGDGTVVGPHCVIDGRSRIGERCRLHAGVVLRGLVEIGHDCLIFPGAVLGADGFRFERVGGATLKIPQVGRIVVEDEVEIGANTTVDRAFLSETRIGRGTKIDNQVQIAHNVSIGPHCFIAAQVGIAGSTRIGAGCLIGGHAGFRDKIEIGPGTRIGGMTGIHKSFPEGGVELWGYPATPLKRFARIQAVLQRLPELERRVRALEKGLAE
jgi:UDP-3-O-[3-hydroxymyristoyl] glucosamine N-acyltransferase